MVLKWRARLMAGAMMAVVCSLPVAATGQTPPSAATDTPQANSTAQLVNLARRFGSRGSVLQISLSPSGRQVAFISPLPGAREQVEVVSMDGGKPKVVMVVDQEGGNLAWCRWVTEENLVCGMRGTAPMGDQIIGFSRLFSVRADGSGSKLLSVDEGHRALGPIQFGGDILAFDVKGQPGQVLMSRQYVPDFRTGSLIGNEVSGIGVEIVDVGTLRRRQYESPREGIAGYIADEEGVLRVLASYSRNSRGYVRGDMKYSFQRKGKEAYEPLPIPPTITDFDVYAVDSAHDRAIVMGRQDGFMRLFSVALDGSGKIETLLAQDGFDVDQLVRIGRLNRVVGAGFATDRRQVQYFDPELSKLLTTLEKALGGKGVLEVVDASADEARLLLIHRSDVNPGVAYLYDKATRQLQEVLPLRAQLDGLPLSTMRAVSYKAADGTMIPAYLTLPPGKSDARGLPAIVMPHGGPEARDEWGFDWMAQFYAQRGFAVLQPNFRGSSGYGEAWLMENGIKNWSTAVGDVNDAGRWLVQEGIADPARLAVVGWSYGGYAALLAAVTDPALYKGVVAIAPLTDLDQLRQDSRNFANYPEVSAYLGSGSNLDRGSPTKQAARITAPVMLVHGTRDQAVRFRHSELMADALRDTGHPGKFTRFEGLDHALYDSEARAQLLAESDVFLNEAFARP
ncbi:MAG: S9 family peptidase [Croceibacterium sp.]